DVVQICRSKNEPTRPQTAFAPEAPDLGRAARELRPQADGSVRLRPPRPAPAGRKPRPASGAQPAPPPPRDAARGQRLAEHAEFRRRPPDRQTAPTPGP